MHFDWSHTVTSAETDWFGHASNVAFVEWLQGAAIAHSSSVGWSQETYLAHGAAFMVRSHQITYLGQAKVGDLLVVRTWVEDVSSAQCLRRYEIEAQGEKPRCIARAQTIWAFVDLKKGIPRRIPEEILSVFPIRSQMPAGQTSTPPPEKYRWTLSEW